MQLTKEVAELMMTVIQEGKAIQDDATRKAFLGLAKVIIFTLKAEAEKQPTTTYSPNGRMVKPGPIADGTYNTYRSNWRRYKKEADNPETSETRRKQLLREMATIEHRCKLAGREVPTERVEVEMPNATAVETNREELKSQLDSLNQQLGE